MARRANSQASILIASDSPAEADVVKLLLEDDFDNIEVSVDPSTAVADFRRQHAAVLLLAFKDLQKSEEFYLGLYRGTEGVQPPRHRALILCSKETVQQAYQRCRRGLFDDYVVFWPVTQDVTRLLMCVYRALEDLRAVPNANDMSETCAAQARRLLELEALLSEQLHLGQEHIASTGRAVAGAEDNISRALDRLLGQLPDTELAQSRSVAHAELAEAINRCRSETVMPYLRKVNDSLQPLTRWAGGMQHAVSPYLQCARVLGICWDAPARASSWWTTTSFSAT